MKVKCQRSVFTTDSERQMLLYDEAQDWIWEGHVNDEWNALFDRYGERFFAEVASSIGPPDFLKKLPEQGW